MCEFVVLETDIKHVDLWRAMKVNKEGVRELWKRRARVEFPPVGEIGEFLLHQRKRIGLRRENLNVFFSVSVT